MAELGYLAERVSVVADQLATLTGRNVGDEMRLDGVCPVCRHRTHAVVPLRATAFEGFDTDRSGPLTASLSCMCGADHPGRPAAATHGCGRTWAARAVEAADTSVILEPADDPDLVDAADALHRAVKDDPNPRSVAEKWIAGITAMIGLFGLAGVGIARDSVSKLATPAQVAVGVAALAAISLA